MVEFKRRLDLCFLKKKRKKIWSVFSVDIIEYNKKLKWSGEEAIRESISSFGKTKKKRHLLGGGGRERRGNEGGKE